MKIEAPAKLINHIWPSS